MYGLPNECACCACDPSVHLSVPSIGFVCVFVCQRLSPHLRVWEQVFALLMLFLCVIWHTMWSGKSEQEPAVAVHLALSGNCIQSAFLHLVKVRLFCCSL